MEKEIIYVDEIGSCYSEETNKTTKEFFRQKSDLDYFFKILNELNVYKKNWNELKAYMLYRKNNFDKLMASDYASFEISGKRILIEDLIYKIEKLEKGSN